VAVFEEVFDTLFQAQAPPPVPEPSHYDSEQPTGAHEDAQTFVVDPLAGWIRLLFEHGTKILADKISALADRVGGKLKKLIKSGRDALLKTVTDISDAVGGFRYWDLAIAAAAFVVGSGLVVAMALAVSKAQDGNTIIIPGSAIGATILSIIGGAIGAAVLTYVGLALWQAGIFQRAEATSEAVAPTIERNPPKDDGTVFRVGWLGGAAPQFLTPPIAAEIAELFAYRSGAPEFDRLDVRRTIAERVRGGDPASIYMEARRELPTILLLVDVRSDAGIWNTLPAEFEKALIGWGVAVEKISYAGSFFSAVGRGPSRPVEALQVEEVIASPGWTVTTKTRPHRSAGNAAARRNTKLRRHKCSGSYTITKDEGVTFRVTMFPAEEGTACSSRLGGLPKRIGF
jgi:hypothetical protein